MPQPILLLKNGIRLIHKEINSPISHFGILVNAGTRDEDPSKMGIAHFVEHTIFKGTQKRSAHQIIRRMEDVGGDLNASTSKEETYFHASFLSPDYPRAVELLADIFSHSTFPEQEIEKEKDVVIEEINYYKDTPSELIIDDFETLVFQQHPLGRNILGTRKDVKHFKREDILNFIGRNYAQNNVVLASVGNISEKQLLRLCERYFSDVQLTSSPSPRNSFSGYMPQHQRVNKHSNQSHIMIGNIAYPIRHESRLAFQLLTNILGGPGMNTRLNMAIRENKGLAYGVEAVYSPFSDSGLFSIYIGCEHDTIEQCINLSYKELKKLCQNKLGTLQLHYAKKQFLGQIAIANEAKLNEMIALGRTALFFDEVESTEESIAKLNALTAEVLLQAANEILLPDQMSTLIFGKP
jgi:predicted Zn-dependent peptidase